MAQLDMREMDAEVRSAGDWKGLALALLLTLIASGLLPILSFYSRYSTWGIWATALSLIALSYRELPLGALTKPVLPYLIWLLCFIVWGLIVSPVPAFSTAIKAAVTTIIIVVAMAIVTSRSRYLKAFANAMQWVILGNLLLYPLMTYSSKFHRLITAAIMSGEAFEAGISRFAGVWGNPNMAGYVCLIAIVVSVWATPLTAWIGRLSALPILYLSASRKSMVLLLLFILLNVVIVQRQNLNRLFVWIVGLLMLASLLLLSDSALRTARTRMTSDSKITRMLDLTESNTTQLGGETRVDLLQEWLQVASREPWYGYGFGAMAGRYDTDGRVISHRLPTVGSHNTYLGVYIEAGAIGFAAFILMLLYYTKAYLVFRGAKQVQWALLSLLACNVIFLVVSHSHLFSFEGKVAYALFFLLPSCPALNRSFGGT